MTRRSRAPSGAMAWALNITLRSYAVSEKGKNPSERSKGGPKRSQTNQHLQPERQMNYEDDDNPQVEESLREHERKPNRA